MSDKKNESRDFYKFDSSGLSKAAAAAKYLDGSDNADKAFNLATMKEETSQLEMKARTEELTLQRTKVAEEERRKTV